MPLQDDPTADKRRVRDAMRRRRDELTPAQIDTASRLITQRVSELLGDRERVGLYAAVRGEAEVRPDALASNGRTFAWPVSTRTTRAITFHLAEGPPTDPGAYGIPEPSPTSPVEPEALDVVIVPGLAFDRSGRRLGHGAGYYDRFLPELRADALRVGVCFDWQLVYGLPAESHDVRMTHVVTESETIITGR